MFSPHFKWRSHQSSALALQQGLECGPKAGLPVRHDEPGALRLPGAHAQARDHLRERWTAHWHGGALSCVRT